MNNEKKGLSRRDMLKLMGVSAAGIALGGRKESKAETEDNTSPVYSSHYEPNLETEKEGDGVFTIEWEPGPDHYPGNKDFYAEVVDENGEVQNVPLDLEWEKIEGTDRERASIEVTSEVVGIFIWEPAKHSPMFSDEGWESFAEFYPERSSTTPEADTKVGWRRDPSYKEPEKPDDNPEEEYIINIPYATKS